MVKGVRQAPPRPTKKPSPRIPRPVKADQLFSAEIIDFSFKHLDTTHQRFGLSVCDADFFYALFEEIKALSSDTVQNFCLPDKDRHSHQINFEQTTEPNGFPDLGEQLEPELCWQFALRKDRPWRVHGFFIGSTFYIIWFDPSHQLDPTRSSAKLK